MNMNLFLYDDYSESQILSSLHSSVMYQDTTTKFVHTNQGVYLFGLIGEPSSWIAPIPSGCSFFLSPESLWVFLDLQHWINNSLLLENNLNSIEILGRCCNSTTYTYLGRGQLTCYGAFKRGEDLYHISYSLNIPITLEAWVKYGGFSHWLMVIGEKEILIRSYEEAASQIESLWGGENPTISLTRYEGDTLQLGINQNNEVGIVYLSAKGHAIYSRPFDKDCDWVWFNDCENYSVPDQTLISREKAMAIIKSYLTTGRPIGLPGYFE